MPYQHTELLGAIWRESVEPYLRPGERAITLAALLHRDPAGVAFAEPLIARSGLTRRARGCARLHEVTLPPLLHVLYRFGAAFSPHAQNCLLVLRDDVPVRLVVKDFVDDVMICSDPLPELADMPADVRAALGDGVEAALLAQWIQGGLLVCVHRYLAEILEDRLGYPEAAFWAAAERAVARLPGALRGRARDRFALFDIDAPAFVKLCLNRVRMLERGYADDAERPVAAAVGLDRQPARAAHDALRSSPSTSSTSRRSTAACGRARAARARHRAAVDVDAQAARRPVLGDGLAARLDPRLPRAPERGPGALAAARLRRRHRPSATSRSTTRPATCSARTRRCCRATSARTC